MTVLLTVVAGVLPAVVVGFLLEAFALGGELDASEEGVVGTGPLLLV